MMKNLLMILVLCMAITGPVHAQEPEPYHIYLPLVETMPDCERTWRIIQPDGVSNEVLNPSAETTGNFAGAAATRSTTYSHYGLYSYRLQTVAGGQGIVLTTAALANATHYVTLRVRGALPPAWALTIGATIRYPRLIEVIDADWSLYGALFTAAECNGQTSLSVTQSGAGTGDFYVDGVQVEANAHWTTYIDGTQEGCTWLGTEHASTSERSAQSRAGGRALDLWADFGFFVEEVVGVGAAPETISTRSYAILPGGELSGSKTNERNFTLIGRFVGDSEHDLHQKRQELLEELGIDTYPAKQAVRLRFSGATVQKQIAAHYTGGLEAQLKTSYGPWQVEGDSAWRNLNYWTEKVAIQFLAPDPMWYEIGESAALLDTSDSVAANFLLLRDRDDGNWSDANFTGDAQILAFAVVGNYLYVGGHFTIANGDGNQAYIARLDRTSGTWSALGAGLNGAVRALAVGADGLLYIGGEFTDAGGVPAADYICTWNGTAFAALGVPVAGAAAITAVYDIVIAQNGGIYIGGDFTDWANIANADYAVYWDISAAAYVAVAAGANSIVYALAVGLDGTIYLGGDFTNWGDADGDYITSFDGTNLASLGSGLSAIVYDIAIAKDGRVYIVGGFQNAGGNAYADYITVWNGTEFASLSTGLDDVTFALNFAPDGMLYISGTFLYSGGLNTGYAGGALNVGLARWNGSAFLRVDLNQGDNITIGSLFSDRQDPVVENNYDLYMSIDNTPRTTSGNVTVTNDGTYPAFPLVRINRSGGTTVRIESLRNETTGKEINLDYDILDGETLTIDLAPTKKSVVSSLFGRRFDAILPPGDFGAWGLQPGSNDVTAFVNPIAGNPTIVGYLLWKDTYRSLD